MVVDHQPGIEPEGPHGLGLLSCSQMSLKPRIGSNRVRPGSESGSKICHISPTGLVFDHWDSALELPATIDGGDQSR
ncbi:hypothetical protein V6N13_097738 [Hibiscus sabdariffa]